MSKPSVRCPASYVRQRVVDGNWVVVCRIIANKMLAKEETYPHFENHPSNCENEEYLQCQVWRDEKDIEWKNKIGAGKKYSSLKQAEKVIV